MTITKIELLEAGAILVVLIAFRVLLAYNRLFDSVPKGESKQWTYTLPTGHRIAFVFTNKDGKHGTFACGGFRITRRK